MSASNSRQVLPASLRGLRRCLMRGMPGNLRYQDWPNLYGKQLQPPHPQIHYTYTDMFNTKAAFSQAPQEFIRYSSYLQDLLCHRSFTGHRPTFLKTRKAADRSNVAEPRVHCSSVQRLPTLSPQALGHSPPSALGRMPWSEGCPSLPILG